jgi:hypothetical protein
MREIQLTKWKVALVDDADFEWLNQWKWSALERKGIFHVKRSEDGKIIYMHRLIFGLSDKNILCDHRDRNGLNNQRDNLRTATRSENNCNIASHRNSSSKYLGVHFFKRDSKWCAHIEKAGKKKNLGYFETEEAAAIAYNEAAVIWHGEFANLNKVAV